MNVEIRLLYTKNYDLCKQTKPGSSSELPPGFAAFTKKFRKRKQSRLSAQIKRVYALPLMKG